MAIANAIFVRNRNSLTKSEQPMRSFAIQTGCQSSLVSMAITLSGPLSNTGCCLISQRFALAAVFARPLQKTWNEIIRCVRSLQRVSWIPSFHCPRCVPKVRRISLSRRDYRQNRPGYQFARDTLESSCEIRDRKAPKGLAMHSQDSTRIIKQNYLLTAWLSCGIRYATAVLGHRAGTNPVACAYRAGGSKGV